MREAIESTLVSADGGGPVLVLQAGHAGPGAAVAAVEVAR